MNNDAVIQRLVARMEELGTNAQAVALHATGKKDTVRNWLRQHKAGETFSMRQVNLEAVAGALNVSTNWLLYGHDDPQQAPPGGFSEETAPYTANQTEEQAVKTLFAGVAKHPQIGCRAQTGLPGLGVAPSDLIVIDLGRETRPGDLAQVHIADATNNVTTIIRRHLPPYLLAQSTEGDTSPLRDDDPQVTVRYPVIGLIRGVA